MVAGDRCKHYLDTVTQPLKFAARKMSSNDYNLQGNSAIGKECNHHASH